jgi:hypothetical protein
MESNFQNMENRINGLGLQTKGVNSTSCQFQFQFHGMEMELSLFDLTNLA